MQAQNDNVSQKSYSFFSDAINFFKKKADVKKDITEALILHNGEMATSLINDYVRTHTAEELHIFLNTPNEYGDTLLEESLSGQQYSCSALFLELGSDPNKFLRNGAWKKHLHIENSLGSGDSSVYFLLSLYGASIEGIIPDNINISANKRMQKHIDHAKNEFIPLGEERLHQMRLAEEALKQHHYQDAAATYQKVSNIWEEAYQKENTCSILKDFYYQKNLSFLKKIVELNKTYLIDDKEKSSVTTLHQRKNDEHAKLRSSSPFSKY